MSDPSGPIAALRASHERLAALVRGLAPEAYTAQAYPKEWNIAAVLGHLGSGAEITALALDAALTGAEPPGREANRPIWDRWNAKAPADQVRDSIEVNESLVQRLEALTADQRANLSIGSFLGPVDVDTLARLRLNEHAVHTWDVAVTVDPTATLGPEAVGYVLDGLGMVAGWSGRANGLSTVVNVATTDPARELTLRLAESVALMPAAGSGADNDAATLRLPAEAFVRLVYGRLDAAYTPPLTLTGLELDDLRAVFPGI
jgi:uncharacterized protein (TIGR03083 family)